MKKFLIPMAAMCIMLAGCNKKPGTVDSGLKISVDPISADVVGIDEQYLPAKSEINQLSGEINVALDFEGRDVGWKAAAEEYQRLQGNHVKVNILTGVAGDQYGKKLNEMLQEVAGGATGEWDIVEGNLGYGRTRKACIDIHSFIKDPNPYCGKDNESWTDVLTEEAYRNYESDTGWGNHYILNTENMQSAWFINDVAFQATKDADYVKIQDIFEGTNHFHNLGSITQLENTLPKTHGYKNDRGEFAYPVTWNDLINLCRAMKAVGYTNPLGISFSSSSIKSLQFTWLLRIYGDYYYRQYYQYTMAGSAEKWAFDKTASCPELGTGFGFKHAKVLNLLFDENSSFGPGYVGYKSEVYYDFVAQLYKMKDLLIENADQKEFNELRNEFKNQSSGNGGKSSAQICLDYLGQGLNYLNYENSNFRLGYFDYPEMVSSDYASDSPIACDDPHNAGDSIVERGTKTRDIGGNGGFVSIINQTNDLNRTAIAKDFIKFFLSPYGQSIYYKGLNESAGHISPKGITTVDTDLVNIPSNWNEFFRDAKNAGVKFNGNVDPNLFLSYGVRYFQGYQKSEVAIVDNWRKLIVSSQPYDIVSFGSDWHDACKHDLVEMSTDPEHGWDPDMYKKPIEGKY